ncbi:MULTISPECIES: hypothetical protein [Agrobacterium]|uniref:hypothetical protein n=1 Tax=Agrobacterium TaxID=357 RepID=UPI002781675B|nr:hypothetical protein [Agrobacterium sp. SORGH_AS_0745]MDP9760817.1 hypothetical protein [Agrobacterium tumefaciens]MDQ1221896.1 hypothetical protein [Agrobacterium sp. SORGH_AS_0745]
MTYGCVPAPEADEGILRQISKGMAMAFISANSTALTILNQTFSVTKISDKDAASSILAMVSGGQQRTSQAIETISTLASQATKAKLETVAKKETVSAAIPQATMSAMNAAATNMMSSYYVNPIERTAENAEFIVTNLIIQASRASPRYDPEIIVPPREEYNAQYAEWGAKRIANGEDETVVKKQVEHFTSDRAYEARVELAALRKANNGYYCAVSRQDMYYSERALKEFFGSAMALKLGENGQVSVTPGVIYYDNGRKMIEYNENGELEIFDSNGNFTKKYKKSELQS